MNAKKFTRLSSPICIYILVSVFALLFKPDLSAQQENLPCNTRVPWVNDSEYNFSITRTQTVSPPLILVETAEWILPQNVDNGNISDFATASVLLAGYCVMTLTDQNNTYSAGNYVG